MARSTAGDVSDEEEVRGNSGRRLHSKSLTGDGGLRNITAPSVQR